MFCFPTLALVLAGVCNGQTAQEVLEFVPSQTTVTFTVGDVLHTVHGAFGLKRGRVTYDPSSGEVAGELIVDATTGHSGNGMRDGKMNKEVLESAKYPEIIFRPDRVDGKVGMHGISNVLIHGIMTIHGGDHEMTIPIQTEMTTDHWTATGHFVVPYAKWGMKNPSTFILRVSASVEIDVHASGQNPQIPSAGAQ